MIDAKQNHFVGQELKRSMEYGPETQTQSQNFLITHRKIILLSACHAIPQKDPLRPGDPRKQKRLSHVCQVCPWQKGPKLMPRQPASLSRIIYLFSKQIDRKPLQNCSPFPHLSIRRLPIIISTVNSEKTNFEKWTRYPFPTMCVLCDDFKRLDQMLFLTKYKGRQSAQHMWNRQGNFTGFPEIAILYHTEAHRHQAQLFEF